MADLIVAVFGTAAQADAVERDLHTDGISTGITRYRADDHNAPRVHRPKEKDTAPIIFLASLVGRGVIDETREEVTAHAGQVTLAVQAIDHLQCAEVTHIIEGHAPRAIEIQRYRKPLEPKARTSYRWRKHATRA